MKYAAIVGVFVLSFAFTGSLYAQIEPVSVEVQVDGGATVTAIPLTTQTGVEAAVAVPEADALEGIEVKTSEKVPSGLGLWWRGMRERVAVATTFNPVKKAEKQLKFAEERLQIAKTIAEKSDDPKVQEKAEKMVARANVFMQRVEERKDKWMEKKDERSERLLKNIATHELRREKIMDRLEEKLPEDKLEKIREHRAKALEQGERLLNAINNENAPDKVRQHLQNVKIRIETRSAEVKEFRVKAAELKAKAEAGDVNAKTELKNLREERKENVQERQENRKDAFEQKKSNRQDKAEAGDARAAKKLETLNNIQDKAQEFKVERKEIKQEAKEKLREVTDPAVKAEIKAGAREELKANRVELKQDVKAEVKEGRKDLKEMRQKSKTAPVTP